MGKLAAARASGPRGIRRPAVKRDAEQLQAAPAFEPDILPPPAKVPRGGWKCLRCGSLASKEHEWARYDDTGEPIGESCSRCWAPFQSEFQRDGTWSEVCHMCSEDTGYNATYEKAAMVLHGEAKLPVDPCEVEESEHYDLEATRSFIGIARSDFQRVTGFSPAAVGLGDVDCPNELGQNFKGIIVVNPMRPWVEYNLTHRQRVGARQLKLPQERVCREGQGSEALQREREKKEND